MKKRLLNIIVNISLLFAFLATPALVYAAPTPASACGNGDTAKSQVLQGVGSVGGSCSGAKAPKIAQTVVKLISFVTGIAAVIMVVVAGFKYITSNGDSNRVASAKTTLVYALIGIAIAALAQTLVHFVINKV